MYVYFIKTLANPPMLKIGKASNPEERLSQLQTGCPYELKIVGRIKCKSESHALEIEKSAHQVCRTWFVRGEWFRFNKAWPFLEKMVDNGSTDFKSEINIFRDKKQKINKAAKIAARIRADRFINEFISDDERRMDQEFRAIIG